MFLDDVKTCTNFKTRSKCLSYFNLNFEDVSNVENSEQFFALLTRDFEFPSQVSLSQLQVDFYPYHLASGDRAAWIRYQVKCYFDFEICLDNDRSKEYWWKKAFYYYHKFKFYFYFEISLENDRVICTEMISNLFLSCQLNHFYWKSIEYWWKAFYFYHNNWTIFP